MKRQAWVILIAGLALMGGTAVFLNQRQATQKLGVPGVRVAPQPVFDTGGKEVAKDSVPLPERVLDFTSKPQPVAPIVLNWLPKDTTYGQRLYKAADGFDLQVNVVLMGGDRTSIHKPQYCLTGQGWMIARTEQVAIPITQPHPYALPVMKLTTTREFPLSNGQKVLKRGIYVYWFVADNQMTADHVERMWWMARDMVRLGVLQRWAYVACFAVCDPGQEDATYERVRKWVTEAVPQFQLAAGPRVELARRR